MRTLWEIFSNCESSKCKKFNSMIAPPFLLEKAGLPFRLLRIRIFRLLKDDVAGLLSASALRVCAIFRFASRSIAKKSERRFLIEMKSLIHRSTTCTYMALIQHRRVVVKYACLRVLHLNYCDVFENRISLSTCHRMLPLFEKYPSQPGAEISHIQAHRKESP